MRGGSRSRLTLGSGNVWAGLTLTVEYSCQVKGPHRETDSDFSATLHRNPPSDATQVVDHPSCGL
jgi:hypothetical protein